MQLFPSCVLAGLIGLVGVGSAIAQTSPAPVGVAEASRDQLAPLLWSPASVLSRDDARIAAEQPGRVVHLAEVGDRINAGGVLARIDDALLNLALQQAHAERDRISAQLDYARSQEHRLSQLVERATVSSSQAQQAVAERHVLEQQLRGAEVAIREAELRLAHAVLRAPFSGTVVERLVGVGEFLNVGTPVLRLVDTSRLELQVRAPVQLAGFVQVGDQVGVRWGEREFRQTVRAVVPVGDVASRQFEVRVALVEMMIPIGTALEVGLPSALPRQVVTVPRDAVVLRPGERYVMRVAQGDVAEQVPVSTGQVMGERIEVDGAIDPGDRLVVRGAERLHAGQNLDISTESATAGDLASGGR